MHNCESNNLSAGFIVTFMAAGYNGYLQISSDNSHDVHFEFVQHF